MGKRRGIVLITTMFFVIIIVMISTLIATQGKMALQSGTVSMQAEEAHMAALSGIDFVRGCLKTDKSFGTDKSSIKSLALNRGIKIDIDDKQNITGYMGANRLTSNNTTVENTSASKARFYISFDADNPKNCKYPSLNNIVGSASSDLSKYRRNVEPDTVYVVSKGVCGKCVRYVETVLTNDGNAVLDGATTIGGAVNITGNYNYSEDSPLLKIKHTDPNYIGVFNTFSSRNGNSDSGGNSVKISSKLGKQNIENLIDLNTKVSINASSHQIGNNTIVNENKKENFINTKDSLNAVENEIKGLDSIDKAKSSLLTMVNENTTKIPGGTYIYLKDTTINGVDDEGNTPYYWVYIPSNKSSDDIDGYVNEAIDKLKLDDMNNMKPKKVSEMFSDKNGIKFGGTNGKDLSRSVVVSNDLTLDVDGGSNLNFISINKIKDEVGNITYEQSNTTIDFQIKDNKSILNEKGSLNIVGELTGNGNIISNGNVSFNAGSSLEVDQNSKVAIWADKDINIGRAKNLSSKTTEGAVFSSRVSNSNNVDHGDEADEIKSELELQKQDPVQYNENSNKEPNSISVSYSTSSGSLILNSGENQEEIVNIQEKVNECLRRNEKDWVWEFFQDNLGEQTYHDAVYVAQLLGQDDLVESITVDFIKVENGINRALNRRVRYPIGSDYQTSRYWDEKGGLSSDGMNYEIKARWDGNTASGGYDHADFDIFYKDNNNKLYYVGAFVVKNGAVEFQDNVNTCSVNPNVQATYSNAVVNKDTALINATTTGSSTSSTTLTTTQIKNNLKQPKNIVNNGTYFRGTLYSAEGNINIEAENANFGVSGSVMTLDGGLNIDNAKYIDFTYDPDYVPFFKDKGIKTGVKFMSEFI